MDQLRIKFHAPKEFPGPGIYSRRLHAWILDVIHQSNPELAQEVHDRKQRQLFSIYCEKPDSFILHTPDRNLVKALQQTLLERETIELHDWQAKIEEVHARRITIEEQMKEFSQIFTMRFLTPTTFYQDENYYPLPEITRLLHSAGKVWELCESEPIALDFEKVSRKMRIEHVSILTHRVDFGKWKVIGFRGVLCLNIKALSPDEQVRVWKLMEYGSRMGFGYKTAWGLGQTRLEPYKKG